MTSHANTLTQLVTRLGEYLELDDPTHVLSALAVAVGAGDTDGEPCWLLIVGVPSSGKTETLRGLDTVADEHVDDITSAGLLSWLPGKPPRPVGLLARNQGVVFATIGDLSTLLASSDRGRRDGFYADLRRAFDGRLVRELGNAPAPLRWEGRLTLLAAVTPEIDNYSSHADALGPRWLYVRLPALAQDRRRVATRKLRESGRTLTEHRTAVRVLAEAAVRAGRDLLPHVTICERLAVTIEDAAIVTCLGRAAVPRDGYGRREIIGLPIIEEPPRLVLQLSKLARGLLALGLDDDHAATICRRVALDSMPLTRRRILAVLAHGELLSIAEAARRANANRDVVRRTLEELEAIGIVTYTGADTDEADNPRDGRRGLWHLAGSDGQLIAHVFTEADKSVAKSSPTPISPPVTSKASHSSRHPLDEPDSSTLPPQDELPEAAPGEPVIS